MRRQNVQRPAVTRSGTSSLPTQSDPSATLPKDDEAALRQYQKQIQQIDRILELPVKSLVHIAGNPPGKDDPLGGAAYFPPWLSESVKAPFEKYLPTRSICCDAVLRLWRQRRRFVWLDWTKNPIPDIEQTFLPKDGGDFEQCLTRLDSSTFGPLNPFTAAHIFALLASLGERHAHGGLGFFAFFTMIWSLHRRYPDTLSAGAALEPWEPTAYVTAKCLLPIHRLILHCEKRAGLLEAVEKDVEEIERRLELEDAHSRWRFASALDDLCNRLSELEPLSVAPGAFRSCRKGLEELARTLTKDSRSATFRGQVTECIAAALQSLYGEVEKIRGEAEQVLSGLHQRVGSKLAVDSEEGRFPAWNGDLDVPEKLKFGVPKERENEKEYWIDLQRAYGKAEDLCRETLRLLTKAVAECRSPSTLADCASAFRTLAKNNRKIAVVVLGEVRESARWCRAVLDRESSHLAAGNRTDFDAAELVSALAVAIRWGEVRSPLEIQEGVRKAIEGARPDGSWSPGQPFFAKGRALTIFPGSADIVFTLCMALAEHVEIDTADETLFSFIDWLDRTQVELVPKGFDRTVAGWPSDRARGPRQIDLWTTAFAVQALLRIRELVEHRLWEMCQRRYTVIDKRRRLADIDPVDLGA